MSHSSFITHDQLCILGEERWVLLVSRRLVGDGEKALEPVVDILHVVKADMLLLSLFLLCTSTKYRV